MGNGKLNLTSKVSEAKIGTNSLRATIPEGIVVFMDIKKRG